MMGFFNAFTAYMKKNLTSGGFFICVFMTFLLGVCGSAYYDYNTQITYTVFQLAFDFSRDELLEIYDSSVYAIISSKCGEWFSMFSPILAALAFAASMCDEQTGTARMMIYRSSRNSFFGARFVSGIITGGLAVTVGYVLFCVFTVICFPQLGEYPADMQDVVGDALNGPYKFITNISLLQFILMRCLEMFMYGIMVSVPAMIILTITSNKYLVVCIPFLLTYVMSQLSQKMSLAATEDYENIDTNLLKISNIITPGSLANVFTSSSLRWWILLYNTVLIVAAALFYVIFSGRRTDCGQ